MHMRNDSGGGGQRMERVLLVREYNDVAAKGQWSCTLILGTRWPFTMIIVQNSDLVCVCVCKHLPE